MPVYSESDFFKWPLDDFPTIDQKIRRKNDSNEKVIKPKLKNEYLKEKNPTFSFYSQSTENSNLKLMKIR